ncbi:hypothetical protein LEM8419_02177 [Neolewinella maritima]|uniref:T9SS type A sorting domain-containing protein n=1 Tax=Neolewinella maritima TaxID=1383882 RepID=A0ABN8F2T3_9BACT|nr:T9SS type A sorting domain-containing protein [Neolewinella maritima]CAH1001276.1 hypothetical protein LEM8419_02177 [Neolewinella maritima]
MKIFYSLFALLATGLLHAQAPTDAPPTPTRPAEDVISIFSDSYDDITLNTLSAEFGKTTFTEVTIAENAVLSYADLDFAAIEMKDENAIDLMEAEITHLHIDFWSSNSTSFSVKLVDFGGDGYNAPGGNDTEAAVTRTPAQGEWVSLDYPISQFAGLNTTDISQLIISSLPTATSTVYLDNIYFYSGGETTGTTDLDLPVTFEDEDVTYNLVDFGGAASQIITDPTDEDNMVAETIKTAGAETFAGTTVTLDMGGSPNDPGFATAIPFTTTATTMMVRVWSPTVGTPVLLKVEDSADATRSVETLTSTTVAMQWDTLTFDFADEAPGTAVLNLNFSYNKLSIFFDFGTVPAEAATYYWDDVMFGQSGGTDPGGEAAPLVAAPMPMISADSVLSLFSGAYDDVPVDTWRAGYSQSGYSEVLVEEDSVKLYSNLDFAGIETVGDNALDLTGYTTLHVDYWSSDLDTFRIKLVDFGMDGFDNGTDTEFEIPFQVTQNAWTSLDIPLTDFVGMNLTDINQIIISALPTGAGSIYLDNIFFYKESTTGTRQPVAGVLTAYPNPVDDVVVVTAPQVMDRILLYDAAGRTVANYTVGSDRFALPMGQLRAGLYVAIASTRDGQFVVKLRKN